MTRTARLERNRRMFTGWLLVLMFGLLSSARAGAAEPPILYMFWGEGCPHCEHEKDFLREFHQQYPQVEMRWFEVWQRREFTQLADAMRQVYQIQGASVPMTIMGDWYMVGFSVSGNYGDQIVAQAETCMQQGCPDALSKLGPLAVVHRVRQEAAANAPVGWEQFPAAPAAGSPEVGAKNVVVYYFHGSDDSPACVQMNQMARQAVETGLSDDALRGRVAYRPINAELPDNRIYAELYRLTARAVVVSAQVGGQETQWKKLDRVWELFDDEHAVIEYIQAEIAAYVTETP